MEGKCWMCEKTKPVNKYGVCEKCWGKKMGLFWEQKEE